MKSKAILLVCAKMKTTILTKILSNKLTLGKS